MEYLYSSGSSPGRGGAGLEQFSLGDRGAIRRDPVRLGCYLKSGFFQSADVARSSVGGLMREV